MSMSPEDAEREAIDRCIQNRDNALKFIGFCEQDGAHFFDVPSRKDTTKSLVAGYRATVERLNAIIQDYENRSS